MDIYLETERLILRNFTREDAGHLVALDGDPAVMRHLGGTPTPREVIEREVLPRFFSYDARGDGFGVWAAIERATGEFLGRFMLRPLPSSGPDEADLGYRLRRSAWGQGYGTEGSLALIHKGFADLGLRRVTAATQAANVASRRVMEKAGLTLVRTYPSPYPDRLARERPEVVQYALTKEDWERARR